ncbi:MAG: ABC transporter ATP-binding protein [Candidatus Micrarchaeaceae archaeon]
MAPPILLSEVSKNFGNVKALDRINLHIGKGISIILGANGAGKSTLLRCIDGLYRIDSGSIRVNGVDPYKNDNIHKDLSLLSDNYALYDYLSVKDNMKFFGRLYGMSDSSILERTKEVLKELDALAYLDSKVYSLSRGTKQKIAFCRATINDPSIILLDEPTAFLDAGASERIRSYLLKKEKEGGTILFVTQKIDEVTRFNSKIFVISKGKIVSRTNSGRLYMQLLKDSYVNIRLAKPINSKIISKVKGLIWTNGIMATYIKVHIDSPDSINNAIMDLISLGARIVGVDYTEPLIERMSLEG